jgi:16S rRNA G1207 methylase RsmC
LVANRQMPYEAEIDRHFAARRVLAENARFKVIAAKR